MKEVILYTDGACSYNPGPGGYAAILRYRNVERVITGGEAETTNNRMELLAVIVGLKALKEPCSVTVYSDSAYVVNAFEMGWLNSWANNGWRTADKKEVKNVELWRELYDLCGSHLIKFNKVKGHAGDELNNRCDALARAEISKFTPSVPTGSRSTEG
ncbi:MAG: ribonuclease HI [Clostridia bacterium]|nr:ribonuclease HI [Clostridia bacterium]